MREHGASGAISGGRDPSAFGGRTRSKILALSVSQRLLPPAVEGGEVLLAPPPASRRILRRLQMCETTSAFGRALYEWPGR